MFALVDCNNFYASCERAFNPALQNKPVVVLSNNDGCIITRSEEAKKLGIPMGAPYFKWEKLCQKNNVQVFSSNYELYGDMSDRVMTLLTDCCPAIEIYSIDEAFLLFDNATHFDLKKTAIQLRNKIKRELGLPVSIGLGATKTLAKVANYVAKNHTAENVFMMTPEDKKALENIPTEKIWGIGTPLANRLRNFQIYTAYDLQNAEPKKLRTYFSVTMEKIINELQGKSCLSLEAPQPRKHIISSRSFGRILTDLIDLQEAISHFAAIASEKLRKQQSYAATIGVFLQTSLFSKNDQHYANSVAFPFPVPNADTSYIIRIAKKCMQYLYKEGYQYHKAGVVLFNISSNATYQCDFFANAPYKRDSLMKTIDSINDLYGKNTLFYCAEGIDRPWKIKSAKLSPRYTTRWNEMVHVTLE